MKLSPVLRTRAVTCLVALLCICVATQMLGLPVTFLSLLNEDTLLKSDPISEDFSVLSIVPPTQKPGLLSLFTESWIQLYLPVLVTLVFHPPSA